jgi:hypothetical protein
MSTSEKAERAFCLLTELLAYLESRQKRDWHPGIKAVIDELIDIDGQIDPSGFDNARSAYNAMSGGGRGFSDYCIWIDDYEKRVQANQPLDRLRDEIWGVFND